MKRLENKSSIGVYGIVPIEFSRQANKNELKVYTALSSFQGGNDSAYPGIPAIAERAGMELDACSDAITKLVKQGWIIRQRRYGRSNIYQVLFSTVSANKIREENSSYRKNSDNRKMSDVESRKNSDNSHRKNSDNYIKRTPLKEQKENKNETLSLSQEKFSEIKFQSSEEELIYYREAAKILDETELGSVEANSRILALNEKQRNGGLKSQPAPRPLPGSEKPLKNDSVKSDNETNGYGQSNYVTETDQMGSLRDIAQKNGHINPEKNGKTDYSSALQTIERESRESAIAVKDKFDPYFCDPVNIMHRVRDIIDTERVEGGLLRIMERSYDYLNYFDADKKCIQRIAQSAAQSGLGAEMVHPVRFVIGLMYAESIRRNYYKVLNNGNNFPTPSEKSALKQGEFWANQKLSIGFVFSPGMQGGAKDTYQGIMRALKGKDSRKYIDGGEELEGKLWSKYR